MNTAELKLKLFREIDILDKSKLEQVYGILLNFINTENDNTDWDLLSKNQQKGLVDAIDEMNFSDGINHQYVIEKYKLKHA